jgi:hypothetical protein
MASAMRAAEAGYQATATKIGRSSLGYHAVALNALGRTDLVDPRLELRRESLGTETRGGAGQPVECARSASWRVGPVDNARPAGDQRRPCGTAAPAAIA